ncbi:MAG: hypothetical protein HQL72_02375 [Magnetococcales bacterium]|nr:hypothetical protein [Magnetococcales bacterium]
MNGKFRTLLLFLVVFCLPIEGLAETTILHIEKSSYSWHARVTVRVPADIPLNYWVACDYYDHQGNIIASTNHGLLKRTPTWSVKAKPEDIVSANCYIPR